MIPRSTSNPSYRRALLAGVVATGLALGPLDAHGRLASSSPVAPRAAFAGAPEGPNPFKEQVDKLNAQAVEKFQAKQYDEAAALFEQAYELQPEPNYLFNIGRIYEESGNLEKSVEYYERFVKEPGVPLDARERGLERLRVLRAILEETKPEPEPEPEPEVEPEPEPEVEPEPAPKPEPPPEEPKPSKLRIAGYALLGTGGAVLIGGGVLGGLALGRANALEGQHTLEERDDTASRGRGMALGADIMFGVGGALAAAGLVMVLVTLKKKPTTAARAAISPWAGPRGTGVAATVRF